ncbi:hypothetical protein GYH30_031773 [Glycine max]|nr:hypothetical protein GYH30_031773 [Glycine max]
MRVQLHSRRGRTALLRNSLTSLFKIVSSFMVLGHPTETSRNLLSESTTLELIGERAPTEQVRSSNRWPRLPVTALQTKKRRDSPPMERSRSGGRRWGRGLRV